MLLLYTLLSSWQIKHIKPFVAITTIRLWHELHVAKNIPHDFENMLAPCQKSDIFVSVICHNEIRSIAQCTKTNKVLLIKQIANPPEQLDAPTKLVELVCQEENFQIDWKSIRSQPRWYFEFLSLANDVGVKK